MKIKALAALMAALILPQLSWAATPRVECVGIAPSYETLWASIIKEQLAADAANSGKKVKVTVDFKNNGSHARRNTDAERAALALQLHSTMTDGKPAVTFDGGTTGGFPALESCLINKTVKIRVVIDGKVTKLSSMSVTIPGVYSKTVGKAQ